jgi:hypothetical protein
LVQSGRQWLIFTDPSSALFGCAESNAATGVVCNKGFGGILLIGAAGQFSGTASRSERAKVREPADERKPPPSIARGPGLLPDFEARGA